MVTLALKLNSENHATHMMRGYKPNRLVRSIVCNHSNYEGNIAAMQAGQQANRGRCICIRTQKRRQMEIIRVYNCVSFIIFEFNYTAMRQPHTPADENKSKTTTTVRCVDHSNFVVNFTCNVKQRTIGKSISGYERVVDVCVSPHRVKETIALNG